MNIPEGWKLVPIEPTEEMKKAADDQCFYCDSCKEATANPLMVWSAMIEAAPTPPSNSVVRENLITEQKQEDEPVAWVEVKDSHNGPYEFHGQELLPPGKHNLYTRPDGLRKAAEEALAWFENPVSAQKSSVELADNLRAALEGRS